MNKLGQLVATAFKDHNYGKKYEELRTIAELLEIEFVEPKFHSETRFANSCSKVFDAGFKNTPALIESYRRRKTLLQTFKKIVIRLSMLLIC